jgi:hypothetical protein
MSHQAGYVTNVAVGNDKTIVVPDNRSYELISGNATITTTASVGNRTPPRLEIRNENGGPVVFTVDGTASVAASQTDAAFGLMTRDAGAEMTILEGLAVPPGGEFRFFDPADIDVLDTLVVNMMFLVRRA